MSAVPKVGESEWYVMKALWASSPLSGSDIVSVVSQYTDWSQSTILTMVRRLVKKGAIGIEHKKVMMYYPLVEENEIAKIETDMFVKRVYQGSINMLIKGFLENGKLSKQDLSELKKMIDDIE